MARSSRFLYFGAFANLEVLRIRNLLNGHRDVLVLLETLPALKTLTLDWRSVGWICCEEACAPLPSVIQMVMETRESETSRLQELKDEETAPSSSSSSSSSSTIGSSESSTCATAGRGTEDSSSASIEIILQPADVESVLRRASEAERTAWATGRMLPGQRCRLLIRDEAQEGEEGDSWAA